MYHHWISRACDGEPAPLKEQAISTSSPLCVVMSCGTSVKRAAQKVKNIVTVNDRQPILHKHKKAIHFTNFKCFFCLRKKGFQFNLWLSGEEIGGLTDTPQPH